MGAEAFAIFKSDGADLPEAPAAVRTGSESKQPIQFDDDPSVRQPWKFAGRRFALFVPSMPDHPNDDILRPR